MYDNSFWGSANVGGYQIVIGRQPSYPAPYPPVYTPYPPAQAGFGSMDSTFIMLLVLGAIVVASL